MVDRVLVAATLVSLAALPVGAADVPIANPGFEQVVLACAPGDCQVRYNAGAWTGTGNYYTFKPATGPGRTFTSGLPDGVNVAALDEATLSQTLGVTLQPDTTYTLVFYVGARTEFPFPGYKVELLAGSTTLASDSSLSPLSGTFAMGKIVYSSGANPELLGQRLGIRLTGYGRGGQTCFDKISLDATPTIVSGSFSQIASGGSWKTTLTLLNFSATQRSVKLLFRRDDGSALVLPLVVTQRGSSQIATNSSVERTVEPGSTLLVESEGLASSPTLVGWAELVSSGPLAGFAIFRARDQDGRDSEGTATLEYSSFAILILPYDNSAGFSTGVAIVNRTNDAVIVNATIRDDNGIQLDLQAVALGPMGHTSFAIADRFPAASRRRGFIEFKNTAGGAITGLGLRFNPYGSFTSVPVAFQ